MNIKASSLVQPKLITPIVAALTFLRAATADQPGGLTLSQQFSITASRILGGNITNPIMSQLGLPQQVGPPKFNLFGVVNKFTIGGIGGLVLIDLVREYLPGQAKKFLPLVSAVASGMAAGGIGGFFDDPAPGHGHSSSGVMAAAASHGSNSGSVIAATSSSRSSGSWGRGLP